MRSLLDFILEGRPRDTDIDAEAIRLLGFPVPVADPITEADVREFIRTHTPRALYLRPRRHRRPIEE
ncbi:hypothetical protein GCM10009727_11220 [Actinomadura napierensis]|uniref:Uncharacterized protein n=1 Tax=Actinomadura napierensis TaxID=267854 RepID=A0ABP5JXA7_9ACTN